MTSRRIPPLQVSSALLLSIFLGCVPTLPPASKPTASQPEPAQRPVTTPPSRPETIVADPKGSNEQMRLKVGQPVLFGDILMTLDSLTCSASEPDSPTIKFTFTNASKVRKRRKPTIYWSNHHDEFGNTYRTRSASDGGYMPDGLFPGDSYSMTITGGPFVKPAREFRLSGTIAAEGSEWKFLISLPIPNR